jgi:transposase
MIVIGVDAHTRTHTAAAVNSQTAVELGTLTVPATRSGHERLLAWGKELDRERVWALEDCRRLSGALELLLLQAGEQAVRVPPKMMAATRKSAVSHPDLPAATLPGPEREIRLVIDHRDDLVGECTRHQRRLRWYLHEIDPELRPAPATLKITAHLDQLARKLAKLEQTRVVQISRELIKRIKDLVRAGKELRLELSRLVRRRCPALLSIEGCGVLMAARILAEVDDVHRFPSERHLATYCGVAPLDASSGRQQRHRLNRTGNRRLNMALHMIAVTQIRRYPPARDYIARRRADGKTTREALRTLKRHLVRRIYNTLVSGLIDPDTLPDAGAPMRCI